MLRLKRTKKSSFCTGDHIWVRGRYNLKHHGIVDRRGQRGVINVIHASKDAGRVVVSTLREFSGDDPVDVVAFAPPGEGPAIAEKARRHLDDFYDVLHSNCEHLAFGASHGVRHSPQLQRAVKVAGAFALIAILRRP